MNKNITTESSLLLKIPKSVFSFSDLSGKPFLIPVAVDDNASGLQDISENNSLISEKIQNTSICQLEQPLLMRKTCPQSDEMTSNPSVDSDITNSQSLPDDSKFETTFLNSSLSNQTPAPQTWTSTVSANGGSTGLQNTPHFTPVSQPNVSSAVPQVSGDEQSIFMNYQNVASTNSQVCAPPHAGYFSNSVSSAPGIVSDYAQQSNFYSNQLDYSQPPVITPTTAVVHGNSRDVPQYSSVMNLNYDYTSDNSIAVSSFGTVYIPVQPYWLFQEIIESKEVWYGFSQIDSDRLESAFQQDVQSIVPVNGGRYDAVLIERLKKAVYFDAKDLEIRRCTWFYKADSSQKFIPFPEEAAILLEQLYCECFNQNQWQKIVSVPGIGSVVLENPDSILLYKKDIEYWPPLPDSKASPKIVTRDFPETIEILSNESDRVDHLVFIVQGIGSFCDLRFRTVVECVDGFREIANRLLSSHFKGEVDCGRVGRVEFLPLAWHAKLHTSGIRFDRCMQNITLPSIPKLRHFTNDTLLDILLYSSPSYCQTIIDTVASELNKLYELFMKRNPGFSGKIFVAGHSLGSLILFDILANQNLETTDVCYSSENSIIVQNSVSKTSFEDNVLPLNVSDENSIESLLKNLQLEEYVQYFEAEKIDLASVKLLSEEDLKNIGLPTGPRKKILNFFSSQNVFNAHDLENKDVPHRQGEIELKIPHEDETKSLQNEVNSVIFPLSGSSCMSSIKYPQLRFDPACFFALGSPISMFLAVRGYDTISEDFRFPTCPGFFHIFHPYDPVAYRIEPLIDPNFSVKPVMIPHHKGRKRMHLEIRENLSKVGSEIKQKVLDTLRYTWSSLSGFAKAHTFPTASVEAEVDKLVSEQLAQSSYETHAAPSETSGEEIQIGNLNGGRRIDFVLQEKPIEALNDYIFALTSHSTYWDSEDTVLMFLREIYALQGIVVSQSLDSRQFSQLDHSLSRSFDQVHPNVCTNQDIQNKEKISGTPLFYNQSIPPVVATVTAPPSNFATGVPLVTSSLPFTSAPPSASNFFPSTSNAGLSQTTSVPPPCVTSNQPVGPPPLTGFVKRSPFAK